MLALSATTRSCRCGQYSTFPCRPSLAGCWPARRWATRTSPTRAPAQRQPGLIRSTTRLRERPRASCNVQGRVDLV